ncbi:hypothetical protein MACH09_01610 [Vibrio sp. MACH09]|uniref:glycosyltransferase family 2 protein n=1 Tax=Vibrio sp. MACH09 TaxID=3025122 RepID=UPI00278D8EF5|nr:glycosyltransferase family 2 protein [Vibrio sp. MACH09]GLO59653.1 hypothetical protein MACH09_01610 [Vibrio sp. MACH09]
MKLSVIISTLNRKQHVYKLIENISIQSYKPDEIFILEQGSSDFSENDLPDNIRELTKLVKVDYKSLARARYDGLLLSSGEIVFFLDDDIELRNNYFEVAVSFMKANKHCAGIGGGYINKPYQEKSKFKTAIGRTLGIYGSGNRNRILLSGWGDYVRGENRKVITKADWLFGCNMVYRRKVLFEIDFPVEFRQWSFCEDLYIGCEITNNKLGDMFILPELSVIHDANQSSGSASDIVLRMRILYRYVVWRKIFNVKRNIPKYYCFLRFMLGMFANFMLDFRKYRLDLLCSEYYNALKFLYINENLTLEEINNYVYKKN